MQLQITGRSSKSALGGHFANPDHKATTASVLTGAKMQGHGPAKNDLT
jgi:hypothetical protein